MLPIVEQLFYSCSSATPPFSVHVTFSMHWCLLFCLLMFAHFAPLTAPVVTANQDNFKRGLRIKSISIVPPNDTSEAGVYDDLKYLDTNSTAGYIGASNVTDATDNLTTAVALVASTVQKTVATIASQFSNDTVPTLVIVKRIQVSGTSLNVPQSGICSLDPVNITCINGSISPPSTTKAFDMFNHALGVISLVEICLLALLVLISKWDTLIALFTCNQSSLAKINLDINSQAPKNRISRGSSGILLNIFASSKNVSIEPLTNKQKFDNKEGSNTQQQTSENFSKTPSTSASTGF